MRAKTMNCINLTKLEIYKELATAKNRLAIFANNIYKPLMQELEKGFKTKSDGTLFKKDHERIKTIIDEHKPKDCFFRCHIHCSYALYIEFDTHYKVSIDDNNCCSVAYIKDQIYFWDNTNNKKIGGFYERDLVTAEELLLAEKELKEIDDTILKLNTRKSYLKNLLEL
jgi:hypothetical protein